MIIETINTFLPTSSCVMFHLLSLKPIDLEIRLGPIIGIKFANKVVKQVNVPYNAFLSIALVFKVRIYLTKNPIIFIFICQINFKTRILFLVLTKYYLFIRIKTFVMVNTAVAIAAHRSIFMKVLVAMQKKTT